MAEEYTLTRSEEVSKTTFKLEVDKWDYKLRFACPVCGVEWTTQEYSFPLDKCVDMIYLHCDVLYRNGCGLICKIRFDWGEQNEIPKTLS